MRSWPHAPSRVVDHPGTYLITAGTHGKAPLFDSPEKRDMLEGWLLETMASLGWKVQAWAVFANHYHVTGHSPDFGLRLTARPPGCGARPEQAGWHSRTTRVLPLLGHTDLVRAELPGAVGVRPP